MKKFFHGLVLFAVLIGTFAPISFSVAPHVNVASAGGDTTATTFNKRILVEKTSTINKFKLTTYVTYTFPNSSMPNGVRLGADRIDLKYVVKQISPIQKTIYNSEEFDELQGNFAESIFALGVETPVEQEITLPDDGVYEGYFWEDYNLTSDNIESSKLKFEIKAGEIISQQVTKVASNVRGDTVPVFSKLKVIEPTPDKPGALQFVFTIEYQNTSKSNTDSVTDEVVLHVTDGNGSNPFNQTLSFAKNYNLPLSVTSPIKIYNVNQQIKWWVSSKGFQTSAGKDVESEKMTYTVGDAASNVTADDDFDSAAAAEALAKAKGVSFCGAWSDLNIGCWIIHAVVQYVLLPIPSFVAVITGTLSDLFLHFSIDPSMYGKCDANACDDIAKGIKDGWSIIRDFANIGFIFSLFVAAFMLIMNKTSIGGTSFDPKRTVVRVIIMALLINFSLLFCRLIIQTADIFSNILYNRLEISVTGDGTAGVAAKAFQAAGVKSPSMALISKINPQSIVTSDVAINNNGGLAAYLIISLISLFLYFIFIYLFAQMMFIFAGRIFGLWIGMILAPLAFVSYSIPFLEDNKYIGFENWLKNFTQLAFLTPVYLFFIYLTIAVMDINIGGATLATMGVTMEKSPNWFISVFYIAISKLIPVIAAVFIFMQGKKIATDMSGVVGEMVSKASGAVTGLALGAATGGMALAGRQTFGRAGSALANKYAGSTGIVGSGLRNVGKGLGAATFDVRNNKWAMDKFGAATKLGGEQIDLGKKGLQEKGGFIESGGFRQMRDDRKARIEDEQATAREKAAEERKLNPQSREAIAKRNADRRLAATTKAKEAEEARIASEAGSQSADPIVDAMIATSTASMAENQTKMNLIESQMKKNNMQGAGEQVQIAKEKAAIEAQIAAIGNVSITDPAYGTRKDLIDKKDALEAKSQEVTVRVEAQKTKLTADKAVLQKQNDVLNKKVTKLATLKGKTIDQMKHENEITTLESKASEEGKEVSKVEKEIADKNKKIKEMEEKKVQARKDGDAAKILELDTDIKKTRTEIQIIQGDKKAAGEQQKKIKELEDKRDQALQNKDQAKVQEFEEQIENQKKQFGKLGNAKAAVEKVYGTKGMEDALKSAESAYKTGQKDRLKEYDKLMAEQKIQLTRDTYELDSKNKANQIAYANDLMSRPSGAFAETIGVITGGRIMGGAVNNANQTAAGKVYNTAVNGKKEEKKPIAPKPPAKPAEGKK